MTDRSDTPPLVSVESPYNAYVPWKLARNIQYTILANTHATSLGEVTWTPHLCNTQFVRYGHKSYLGDSTFGVLKAAFGNMFDTYGLGREEILRITHEIRKTRVDKLVCYVDYGISPGMQEAIDVAHEHGVPVEERRLPADLKKHVIGETAASTLFPAVSFIAPLGLSAYGLVQLARKVVRK